jgi:hypothetical protein
MKRFCALRQSRKTSSARVLGCTDGNGTVRRGSFDRTGPRKKCDRVHWISSQSVSVIKRVLASTIRVLCSQGLGPLF